MTVKTTKNLVIDQGSTFSATISVTTDGSTAKNLSGYTTTGQIRKSYGSSTATDFTTAQVDATGVITISLTATQTGALKAEGMSMMLKLQIHQKLSVYEKVSLQLRHKLLVARYL